MPGWGEVGEGKKGVASEEEETLEEEDVLQTNEISISFIASSLPPPLRALTFSSSFYTHPRTISPSFSLPQSPSTDTNSCLLPLLPTLSAPSSSSPHGIRFTFGPESGGGAEFARFLSSGGACLSVDVIDTETGVAVGSFQIPGVRRLLRGGRREVSITEASQHP